MLQRKGNGSKEIYKRGNFSVWELGEGSAEREMLGLRDEGYIGGNHGKDFQAEGTAGFTAPWQGGAGIPCLITLHTIVLADITFFFF